MAGRERLIFALDYASVAEARAGAAAVCGEVGVLKVGLELFVRGGAEAAGIAAENGLPLFLDLKLHDIPETVARAVKSAVGLGAKFLTVHASGGPAMLRAAVVAAGDATQIVAVTVLTSLDADDLRRQGIERTAGEQVRSLALMAFDEGVRAFVCSPEEALPLRYSFTEFRPVEHEGRATIITPGVRPAGAAAGDQKRVSTPAGAIAAGADYLVVGRPIRDAADPAAAARAIAAEIDAAKRG